MGMNKTVCLSGTDRGIGLELVRQLLAEGCIVFAGSITDNNEALNLLKAQFPGKLHVLRLDVGNDESVRAAAEYIRSHTDRLDFIINNAAILGDMQHTIADSPDFDDMQQVYNITALGAIRLSNALIGPVMNGGGLIVGISSEAGSIGDSYRTSWFGYCMAKSALNMGSTIIHNKLKEEGGRVLLLHPGWVKSAMSGVWNDAGTYTPAEAAANILARIEERGGECHAQPLFIEADSGNALPW